MQPLISTTIPREGQEASSSSSADIVSEYSVKAYYLPHYPKSSPPLGAPNQVIDAVVKLKSSHWSIDLQHVFPNGINTDSYFIGGLPQNWPTAPCFCGKTPINTGEMKNETGEWDENWDCTAVCKMRRRYQVYKQEQEKKYAGELKDNAGEYVLFVGGGGKSGQEDIPLLEREVENDFKMPLAERAMVMVRVEGWVPVDVQTVIVEGQIVHGTGEDEMMHLKRFLKSMCSDESVWVGRLCRKEEVECTGPATEVGGCTVTGEFVEPTGSSEVEGDL